jgi:hypothetical protein
LLKIVDPSETGLLDVLRSRMSRRMLEEIAANDYGEEVPFHLKGVEEQMSSTPPLGNLEWCPREVLELERWNDPDKEEHEQHRELCHIKRLFACTILLRNAGHMNSDSMRLSEHDFFLETSGASVARLLRSASALGGAFLRSALAFTLWLYRAQPYPRLRPFVALASALLAILASHAPSETDKEQRLLAWVDGVEADCRATVGKDVESETWLVGLNSYEAREEHRALWYDMMRQLASQRPASSAILSWVQTHVTGYSEAPVQTVR